MKTTAIITTILLTTISTGALAQATTQAVVTGNGAVAASASDSSSRSSVGGSVRGKYSVENFSGASNISGAAVTRERQGNTFIGIAETWSDGQDYSSTVNKGGTGYAKSSQSGSAAAVYSRPLPSWTWDD